MFVSVDSVSCYLGTDGVLTVIDSVTGVGPYNYLVLMVKQEQQ